MGIDYSKYPLTERVRHHTGPGLYFPLSELSLVPTGYPPLYSKIDWNQIFINGKQPDLLDIGCGKGALLLDYALQNVNHNILGIEIRYALTEWINNIIKCEKIPNAATLWYSVVNGLNFISDESINAIFYLFPDPWYKRKHYKRRAFNSKTIKDFYIKLKNSGKFYLATDIFDVHQEHLKLLSSLNFSNIAIISNDDEWVLPQTNKEKFCRKVNLPFYRIIAEK